MTNQRPGNKSRGILDDVIGHMALLFIFLKMAIVLHDKFDSWQEFRDKLDAYCKETYQSFVNDDSKTVESDNKHRKEPFPAELQFAFVRMSCVHYGKKRKQKGKVPTGQRPIQR